MSNQPRRLVDHVTLRVSNLERSKEFYRAIAETLGFGITKEERDRFFIDTLQITQNTEPTQSVHLSFKAQNPGIVKLFHETALRAGGSCLVAPEVMNGNQRELSALVKDPDGNNVEVVFKSPRVH